MNYIYFFVKKIYKTFFWIYFHPLVSNEKYKAIARYFWFHYSTKPCQPFKIPLLKQKLWVVKGQGSQTNYFTYLEDYEDMLFLLHYTRSGDLFIDIGANMGSYSVLAGGVKNANVLSFEPSPINYQWFLKNIEQNNLESFIIPKQLALGNQNRETKIVLNGALSHITEKIVEGSVSVRMKKLDNIADYGDLIKMDVEGYELSVLEGGKSVLSNPRTNALIIEMKEIYGNNSCKSDVYKFLTDLDFRPYSYNPINRELLLLSTYNRRLPNTIFIRDIKQVLDRIRSSISIKVGKFSY